MSLILDALKKVEREKPSGEPGVLVVGAVPWAGARRWRLSIGALAAVALLVIAAALGAWFGRTHHGASPVTPAAAAAPAAVAAHTPSPVAATPASVPPATPAPASTTAAPPARDLALPEARAVPPPAAQPEPAAPPHKGPQLNAISQQDGKPVAVIDGRLVHEGDSIDGVRVLRIGETEVEVEIRGQRHTLRF